MPFFDFHCECGADFEQFQKSAHEGPRTALCPGCGKQAPWRPSFLGFKITFRDGIDICTGQYHGTQKAYNQYVKDHGMVKVG